MPWPAWIAVAYNISGIKVALNTVAWVDKDILNNTTAHAVSYAFGIMQPLVNIVPIII